MLMFAIFWISSLTPMSLFIDKASQWAVAMTTLNVTILSAIAELLKIYYHPVQGKETAKWLLSLRQRNPFGS